MLSVGGLTVTFDGAFVRAVEDEEGEDVRLENSTVTVMVCMEGDIRPLLAWWDVMDLSIAALNCVAVGSQCPRALNATINLAFNTAGQPFFSVARYLCRCSPQQILQCRRNMAILFNPVRAIL